jgi:hypothetical protein
MQRVTEVLVEALKQALMESTELRLYRAGKLAGLFPSRAGVNAEAAAQALREGLLEITHTETKGKTSIEWVRLTPRGVDFLHEHESPARALQDLRAVLRMNEHGLPVWLAEMRATLQAVEVRLEADAQKWQQRLEALERRVAETLKRIDLATPLLPPELAQTYPWALDAINYLDRRQSGGAPGPCPLPELFAALTRQHASLSIGAFHEGLRRMHERRVARLAPGQSLADLPQPEFALLDGALVLYYAAR